MKILSPAFVETWRGRCLNVHPSLLPEFGGGMDLQVHAAVLAAGRAESGCTVHFVTDDVDGGAVVVQRTCSVVPGITPEQLKRTVQPLEGAALIEAVRRFAAGITGERFAPRKYALCDSYNTQSAALSKAAKFDEALTYRKTGVDIDAGNALVERIKPFARATAIPGVTQSLGGFGAVFDIKAAGFAPRSDAPETEDILLVAGTDGVGTKLKLAAKAFAATGKSYDRGMGIDLVAMCVNDVATTGATPLFFLDYYATGALDVDRCASLVEGVAHGCALSGCALVGGETAEMPGLYAAGDYDVAGFAVGAVRRRNVLPMFSEMRAGDILLGLPSNGLHANGFSLVRAALSRVALSFPGGEIDVLLSPATSFFAHASEHDALADVLLAPTRLYTKQISIARSVSLKGAAHITGGGFLENIPRALPPTLAARIDTAAISPLPPLFEWLRGVCGDLPDDEMLRTFNCGLGLILIVDAEAQEAVSHALEEAGERDVRVVGCLVINPDSAAQSSKVILHGGPLARSDVKPHRQGL